MASLLLLCFFAFLAGFVDAMVGGGGLIQLPAMFILQPQLALVQTLATNKTASFSGTLVATIRYIRRADIHWKRLRPFIVSALIASFSGALMVSYINKERFMPFIVLILLLVFIYTVIKKNLGLSRLNKNLSATKYIIYAAFTGLAIGFYDGIIGPGTGSFLIFAFIIVFGEDFLHASVNAKIINCVTNISALSFFLFKGAVVWSIAFPVALANMLGNYAGSHIALKKGSGFIRIFFIVVVFLLICKLGYDYIIAP
jgi:uncharacterized membrane protein YfcA